MQTKRSGWVGAESDHADREVRFLDQQAEVDWPGDGWYGRGAVLGPAGDVERESRRAVSPGGLVVPLSGALAAFPSAGPSLCSAWIANATRHAR